MHLHRASLMGVSLLLCAAVLAGSCNGKKDTTKPTTLTDRISYTIGSQLGQNFKAQNVEINTEVLRQAIDAVIAGDSLLMNDEEMNAAMMELQTAMMEKQEKEAAEALGKVSAFLAENAKKAGVTTLADSLQYEVITTGNGPKPKATDNVKVHYHGTLMDGTVFDSSVNKGEPITLGVSGVIPGWTEILQIMPVGSKWKVYIPPQLAYGPQANGGIPGNSLLIFEIELLEIVK